MSKSLILNRVSGLLLLAGILVSLASVPAGAVTVQHVDLEPGWNLVSFHVVPQDPRPEIVVGALGLDFISLWTQDPETGEWSRYPADVPGIPAITEIEGGRGYWIQVAAAPTLLVSGRDGALPSGAECLPAGWSLVGYPADFPKHYSEVFRDLGVLEIWRWNADGGQFEGIVLDSPDGDWIRRDFDQIEPGYGYWLRLNTAKCIAPVLGTGLPSDIDIEPLVQKVHGQEVAWSLSPGDEDIGADGLYDGPTTQRAMTFRARGTSIRMSIFNRGAGVLNYTVSLDDPAGAPWLRLRSENAVGQAALVDEISGDVTGDTAVAELVADRTGMRPGAYETTITVSSNGSGTDDASRSMRVGMVVAPVDGDYQISAKIMTVNGRRADLHDPNMFLSVFQDATGLKAIADEHQTLLLPRSMQMVGNFSEVGSTRFTMSGSFELPAAHVDNPSDGPLRREITLVGDRAYGDPELDSYDLQGQYFETIRSVLEDPIVLIGTFEAKRLTAEPTSTQVSDPPVALGIPIPPAFGPNPGEEGVVNDTFTIDDRVVVSDLSLDLHVEHPEPQALTISLTSPEGTTVILRQQSSDTVGPRTYDRDSAIPGSLDDFSGELSAGDWVLTIHNTRQVDDGSDAQLVSWSVHPIGTEVYHLSGQVVGVPPGSLVLLTGCGQSIDTQVGPDGHFEIRNLVNCVYRVTVHADGFAPVTEEVSVDGADVADVELRPGPVPGTDVDPPVLPCSDSHCLVTISTAGSSGLQARIVDGTYTGGPNAIDSATFDIDRFPEDANNPGLEDSNFFLGNANGADPVTKTNRVGLNAHLDEAVGGAGYRAFITIGHPISGRSAGGSVVLQAGANF